MGVVVKKNACFIALPCGCLLIMLIYHINHERFTSHCCTNEKKRVIALLSAHKVSFYCVHAVFRVIFREILSDNQSTHSVYIFILKKCKQFSQISKKPLKFVHPNFNFLKFAPTSCPEIAIRKLFFLSI